MSYERRRDPRIAPSPKRSLQARVRSFFNPRVGVDRRKGEDRRSASPEINSQLSSLLSRDELKDLLRE